MILVRFIKLLTIFILTGCSCLRSGQGCNIKEIVSETYNNDSIWTIHVVFNGRPDKFQRKQLVKERITKEHPNEGYRISAMKEYNGKMYNKYIYQIIVESKWIWEILRRNVSLHHDVKLIHRRTRNPSQASAQ